MHTCKKSYVSDKKEIIKISWVYHFIIYYLLQRIEDERYILYY